MSMRRLRNVLRHVLPKSIKDRLRPRLFGFRPPQVGSDWSLVSDQSTIQLNAGGVTARFPESARESLAYHCVENGDSVEELYGFLEHAKKGNGLLVDVGAADGLFSVLFCRAHAGNQVVAFEPSQQLFQHLTSISNLNDLAGRISPVNAAVGRSTGTVSAGLNSVGMLVIDSSVSQSQQMRMVCLDDQLNNDFKPTAIKIDVEGYEGEVLWGAGNLLAACRPVLFLEFHLDLLEQKGVRVSELLQFLNRLDYRFETSLGVRQSARQIANSSKAITRFVARPNI